MGQMKDKMSKEEMGESRDRWKTGKTIGEAG